MMIQIGKVKKKTLYQSLTITVHERTVHFTEKPVNKILKVSDQKSPRVYSTPLKLNVIKLLKKKNQLLTLKSPVGG